MAEKTGLSLRTIQRIENGESVPRGDTLKRLSVALQLSPDELINWQVQEDKNVLTILNLSQLGFLAFPILGTIIPLAIWILQKDKIKEVDAIGKSILNFQMTWCIVLYGFYWAMALFFTFSTSPVLYVTGGLYGYNLFMIIRNSLSANRASVVKYKPSIEFLNR